MTAGRDALYAFEDNSIPGVKYSLDGRLVTKELECVLVLFEKEVIWDLRLGAKCRE